MKPDDVPDDHHYDVDERVCYYCYYSESLHESPANYDEFTQKYCHVLKADVSVFGHCKYYKEWEA